MGVGEMEDTTFKVIADPSVDLTQFLNESGRVEFRAVGQSSDYFGMWIFSRELDKYGQIIEPEDSGPEFVASDSGKLSAVNNPDAVTLNISNPPTEGPLRRLASPARAAAAATTTRVSGRRSVLPSTEWLVLN